jgi:DUF2950 family protein
MRLTCLASLTVLVTTAALATEKTCTQETFASPADAARALVAAVQTNNRLLLLSITGQEIDRLLGTGDPERDAAERESFIEAARTIRFEKVVEDARMVLLYPGNAEEPFPAPLVKTGSGWCFDGESGLDRATRRRIRRNELAAIELCHRYFDAQMEYSTSDHGGGRSAFASRIRSTPGTHDGLYWPIEGGADESPMGPLFAAAAFAEQQTGVRPVPYFGYFFKVLVANSPESRGFALLAWPAEYGVSGLRSFLISDLDQVYQKDLGVDSARAAGRITAFQLDGGWSQIAESGQAPSQPDGTNPGSM